MGSVDTTYYYPMLTNLELADIDSATSEATGYPKEHLLDGSLITCWKPTTTADQSIVIDLNYIPGLTSYMVGFFMRNYTTDPATGRFQLDLSANGTDWTEANDYLISILASANTPVHYHTFTTALTRYMKLSFKGMSSIIEVSHLFIAPEIIISRGPELPVDYSDIYTNLHGNNPMADHAVSERYSIPMCIEQRNYKALSATEYGNFRSVFDTARGGAKLVVVRDVLGVTGGIPFVAKISDTFGRRMPQHELYELSFTITPQQYIDPTLGY
jgi:hypothetical protein